MHKLLFSLFTPILTVENTNLNFLYLPNCLIENFDKRQKLSKNTLILKPMQKKKKKKKF